MLMNALPPNMENGSYFVERLANNEEQRRLSAKRAQEEELKKFLEEQARQNPRLKRLRQRQLDDENVNTRIQSAGRQPQPPAQPKNQGQRAPAQQSQQPSSVEPLPKIQQPRRHEEPSENDSYYQRQPEPPRNRHNDRDRDVEQAYRGRDAHGRSRRPDRALWPDDDYYRSERDRDMMEEYYSRAPRNYRGYDDRWRFDDYMDEPIYDRPWNDYPAPTQRDYRPRRRDEYQVDQFSQPPPRDDRRAPRYTTPSPPPQPRVRDSDNSKTHQTHQAPTQQRQPKTSDEDYFPFGSTPSRKQEKESYAEELRRQMAEAEARKREEKKAMLASVTDNGSGALPNGNDYEQRRKSRRNVEPVLPPINQQRQPPQNNRYSNDTYHQNNETNSRALMNSIGVPAPSANDKAAAQAAYMADLQAQIELKKQKKEMEKQKIKIEDERKEREMANYNPFGRGGAGAPIRDESGNVVTNAKRFIKEQEFGMHANNAVTNMSNPGYTQQMPQQQWGLNVNTGPNVNQLSNMMSGLSIVQQNGYPQQNMGYDEPTQLMSPMSGLKSPTSTMGEKSFRRGVVDVSQLPPWQRDDYLRKQKQKMEQQAALQQQMAEREAQKREDERLRKLEEEQELQRLQREQEVIQKRYEEEQQRKKIEAEKEKTKKEDPEANRAKVGELKTKQQIAEEAYLRAKAEAEAMKRKNRRRPTSGEASREDANFRPQESPMITSPPPFRSTSPPLPALRNPNPNFDWNNINEQSVPAASANPPSSSMPLNARTEPSVKSPTGTGKPPLPFPSSPTEAQIRFEQLLNTAERRASRSNLALNTLTSENAMTAKQQEAMMLDTKAVLAQLNAIQQDLEVEKRKVQTELSKPLIPQPPESAPPVLPSPRRLSDQSNVVIRPYGFEALMSPINDTVIKTSRTVEAARGSVIPSSGISPISPSQVSARFPPTAQSRPTSDRVKNDNEILGEQFGILLKQEQELNQLRGEPVDRRASLPQSHEASNPSSFQPPTTQPQETTSRPLTTETNLVYMTSPEPATDMLMESQARRGSMNEAVLSFEETKRDHENQRSSGSLPLLEFQSRFPPTSISLTQPLKSQSRPGTQETGIDDIEARNNARLRDLGVMSPTGRGTVTADVLVNADAVPLESDSTPMNVGTGWNI